MPPTHVDRGREIPDDREFHAQHLQSGWTHGGSGDNPLYHPADAGAGHYHSGRVVGLADQSQMAQQPGGYSGDRIGAAIG